MGEVVDVAGYCESCDRWFACVVAEMDRFVCAWCGQVPIRFKGRDPRPNGARAATPRMRESSSSS